MNSNAHSSPFHRQPYHPQFGSQPPRPFVQEDTLKSEQIHIERKSFLLTLKENPRGRFLRISEEVNGKRNAIIIPATGLAEFKKLLDEMLRVDDEIAAKREPATLPESSSLAPVRILHQSWHRSPRGDLSEIFRASRWTSGNHLFPTIIEVTDQAVIRHKRSWFSKDEISISITKVASVHIKTGIIWSDI